MKEEIATLVKYRLEQAEAALGDAEFLMSGNRTPHSIINRAYYAMFYAALALLQTTGSIPSKHAGVIGLFDTQFVQKGLFSREMSQGFHKAFELCRNADHRALHAPSRDQAQDMLVMAYHFVRSIRDYLSR